MSSRSVNNRNQGNQNNNWKNSGKSRSKIVYNQQNQRYRPQNKQRRRRRRYHYKPRKRRKKSKRPYHHNHGYGQRYNHNHGTGYHYGYRKPMFDQYPLSRSILMPIKSVPVIIDNRSNHSNVLPTIMPPLTPDSDGNNEKNKKRKDIIVISDDEDIDIKTEIKKEVVVESECNAEDIDNFVNEPEDIEALRANALASIPRFRMKVKNIAKNLSEEPISDVFADFGEPEFVMKRIGNDIMFSFYVENERKAVFDGLVKVLHDVELIDS